MKQSITFSAFVDAFHAYDRYDSFGYNGLRIIFDYLEYYEDQTGEEIELDVIAICCDYNMMSLDDVAREYNILDIAYPDSDDEINEEAILDYLNDNTVVLGQCADGVVFQCF